MGKEGYRRLVYTNAYGVDFDQVYDETWIYYITARDYEIPLAYRDDVASLDEAICMAECELKAYLLTDYDNGEEPRTPALQRMLEAALYEEWAEQEGEEDSDGWGYDPDGEAYGE